ncbi:GTPase IMAP family member 8-like [Leuresthes tenuis]|uniref:GTPase IMAP family member 8-like n=1 Tax=Leuresthes tenuis TaxID=355514 RepID=UPI003B5113A3
MEYIPECATSSEVRLVLIGRRWSGKSSSANTILRKERFDCGRTRTVQAEVRREVVEGRKLIVVDAPGWSSSLSLNEIPEGDKQRFKLNASKCPPGPHVFLLVIPIDSAFSVDHRTTVEQHMKLLGERVWRFTMVLFTCGDDLGEKTIEQHIESEGEALKWLIEKCGNSYHVFNNKDKMNLSQVTELLEKIDQMVRNNGGSYYKVDEQTLRILTEKQQEVAKRAKERQKRAEEQRQQMMTLITEEMNPIQKLQIILLGSRSVGKTSVGNTLLGFKEQEDGKRTAHSMVQRGFVGKTEITLVDTPGWWKGFPAFDTPDAIKEEIKTSLFLCHPGPHIFLLVVDADASFHARHLDAVTTHMELLGEDFWKHTIIVFTRGDWLGTHTIEEYIEGEGEALQSLVEKCGNRYHVLNNKNPNDGAQVTELLEKITGTIAGNGGVYFAPDEKIFSTIEKKRRRVEEAAALRQSKVKAKRKSFIASRNKLQELRIVMLGQKTSGKSATGNTILHKKVFSSSQNEKCSVEEREVADRRVTVIDTPGWWIESSRCTEDIDMEIVKGLSLSPSGVHAVLLVVPLDLTFREVKRVALEEHMKLFDPSIWKHTMVLFTHGDRLADKSVEEHIEREQHTLRWLVDMCENKYHTVNNTRKSDMSQVTELFEKIDEMVVANRNQLFCPDIVNIHLKVSEKFSRKQLKQVLKRQLEMEYRRRELELMVGFRDKLLELQEDIRKSGANAKPKSLIGDMTKLKAKSSSCKKKDEKEKEGNVDTKISGEIKKLNMKILTLKHLTSSMDALLPDLKGDSPAPSIAESWSEQRKPTNNFNKVLSWLSNLQISTNMDNELTLNFSQVTSGYRSVVPGSIVDE